VAKYIKTQPFDNTWFPPGFYTSPNPRVYKMLNYLQNEIPMQSSQFIAKITGSQHYAKNALKRAKQIARQDNLMVTFNHFINKGWYFETKVIYEIMKLLSPEEVIEFEMDVKLIDWEKLSFLYSYGIKKFLLKQEAMSPVSELSNIVPVR